MLAALAYRDDGWDLNLDAQREITDLPAFSYRDRDGDVQMRTSTESLLSEHVAARWVDAGIMPLMGRRDRHSAQLVRWQSLADPVQALRGPWG
jgi:type VI secretion system protein ImpC